jgi:hypothetical protein
MYVISDGDAAYTSRTRGLEKGREGKPWSEIMVRCGRNESKRRRGGVHAVGAAPQGARRGPSVGFIPCW